MKIKLNRHIAREKVLQSLYAIEIANEEPELIFAYLFEDENTESEDYKFAKKLFHSTLNKKKELKELINSKLKNWKPERINTLDNVILQMSLCELMYFEDIPPKVTLNEAINLAKFYSTEESGKFVNGILDALFEKLKTEKLIIKTGRGLLNKK